MNNSEEGCAKCCFWDTPGMQCTKDCGDLNGTYCSQCKDWFCGYHDKVIIHDNKPELDDVCIYCLVRDKNVYQITYTTDLSDEDDSDSNVST